MAFSGFFKFKLDEKYNKIKAAGKDGLFKL